MMAVIMLKMRMVMVMLMVIGDGYKNVDDLFHIPGSKLKLLRPLGLPHTPVCKPQSSPITIIIMAN